jgi:hypothetical protein
MRCCCCGVPYAGRFKLGVLGVLVSLMLFVAGRLPPYNRWLIEFPTLWAAGLILLTASLTVYYDVKEKFWKAYEESVKDSKANPRESSV